ncbi:hypothetical protein [Streptomyces sp. WM6378]|uniref:hypothetical protein n=1 Tax=Streptomyces sp. WM6378 TaxID=1415557 RepID=UPI0006B02D4C|nr:hypothetical protein [Streptomyces sp. WM6378]
MSIFAMRKATTLGAAGLVVVGLLALSACKSGDSSDGAAKGPTTAPSSPSPSSQPDQSARPSSPADQGGAAGDAKGGQTFKIGEAAQFPFKYGTTTKGRIALTVTSIEQGAPADLTPLKLGDKAAGKVPYYIHYSVKNVGTTDLAYASVGHIKGRLGDGTEAQDLMIIGSFEKCPSDSLPKGFTNGKTQAGCAIALAPSATTKVVSAEYWGDPFMTNGQGLIWK